MIKFLLIVNSQGVVRIGRFYITVPATDRQHLQTSVTKLCLARGLKQSSIVDYEDYTVVYRRYGNLTFIAAVTKDENELAVMEIFHHIVETLNKHFGKVTELHIIYNLDKVYIILDEMILNGYIAETSQARILAPLQLLSSAAKK